MEQCGAFPVVGCGLLWIHAGDLKLKGEGAGDKVPESPSPGKHGGQQIVQEDVLIHAT